jgi:hypothetical protein
VPIVLKSGSLNLLEPSGPVKACNGIALLYPLLVARFKRQSRAIPLLSLRAFVACKKDETYLHKIKTCHFVNAA